VIDHDGANGWYTASQRLYTYGGRLMRMQHITPPKSGPCVIVRADLLEFSNPPYRGAWADRIIAGGEQEYLTLLERHRLPVDTLAAVGLGHFCDFMKTSGHPIEPLPFPANVVINHGDSMSTAGGVNGYSAISTLGFIKRTVKWTPTFRIITPAIRREFHIPSDQNIPAAYRATGSVFWR
jgi:hypothetical protein